MSFVATAVGRVSAETTVTFVVPPRCFDQTYGVGANGPGVAVSLRCAESNEQGSFRLLVLPDHGFLDDRNMDSGTLTYVPASNYSGPDKVVFEDVVRGYPSQPATITLDVVGRGIPPMNLRASATEVRAGETPTFTLTMPKDVTGSVGFYDFDQPGPDKGIGVVRLTDGVATLTEPTKDLQVGVHHIQASFVGDNTYAANDSNVLVVIVRGS
jgi:hypothetical protein